MTSYFSRMSFFTCSLVWLASTVRSSLPQFTPFFGLERKLEECFGLKTTNSRRMRFTQIASLPSPGKVRLEAMSNVFEPTSAKLRELHSAVKIAYKKCQEGARRRIAFSVSTCIDI